MNINKMIIGIDRGHNTGKDMGASGIRLEGEMINEVAYPLIELLRNAGHTVHDITGKDGRDLRARALYANTLNLDFVVSIHFNAFDTKANGVEVLYVSNTGKALAEPLQRSIVALGFADRGVKVRTNLYILNAISCPVVLVEGCFCDSKVDMKLYNKDKMIKALYKGITGKEVPKAVVVPTRPPYQERYVKLFQAFYNEATKCDPQLKVDGDYGVKSQDAYKILGTLLSGVYK
jgi:N-acetylmuramoyl-L-alanine amidase